MRAARLHAYGAPLRLDTVPGPQPEPGQVVVAVEGAGLCHSDLHVAAGEIQILPRLPLTLGHENAGTVAEVGRGVTAVRPGDRVAVFGGWGDGRCDYCVAGAEQLCERPAWAGLSDLDGGYADYLLVPHERHLVPLARLEPRVAAPLTDAALTPYRAIRRAQAYLEPDHAALVIGVGGLGQFGLKLLAILAGVPVIAVDVDPRKLEVARRHGASHVLDGRAPDVGQAILDLSRGGVSAAFDFVGSDATLALALSATRAGGKVTQLGLAGGVARLRPLQTTRFEVLFEATLWGSLKELREVIALAESGRLTPIELEFWPLEKIDEALDRLRRGEVGGRIVITP
jgi:propanol-preferring alcohol dehydrogenase